MTVVMKNFPEGEMISFQGISSDIIFSPYNKQRWPNITAALVVKTVSQ